MRKYFFNKYFLLILFIIVLLVLMEIKINIKPAPERIFVRVFDPDKNPNINASCVAEIYKGEELFAEKNIIPIKSLHGIIDTSRFYAPFDEGFYELNTTFKNYYGDYRIYVKCFSLERGGFIGYKIINKSNELCEISNDGKVVVC